MTDQNNSVSSLIFCSLGVFFSYFLYGIIQESITKSTYGVEKAGFSYIKPLLFVQCLVNAVCAYIALFFKSEPCAKISPKSYALCSLSYIGAMFSSNASLRFVNYPTQVVGKSIKPIPVMLLNVFWAGRRYPFRRYLFVGMITTGVFLFMYKGSSDSKTSSHDTLGWGHILLLISLALDGFTGGMQEDFRSRSRIGPYRLMLNLNAWALVYLGLAVLVTGEILPFCSFIQKYPEALLKIFLFGVISAVGQVFIYTMIVNFGSLMCSIVTTTRKFFTVLASIVLFNHTVSSQQILGATLVFAGLLADQTIGKEKKQPTPDGDSSETSVLPHSGASLSRRKHE